jgi:hypothetical protein
MAASTSSIIDVGALVLDMYDSTKKQLVWTGRATDTIDPNKSPEKNQDYLDKAMGELLNDFPASRSRPSSNYRSSSPDDSFASLFMRWLLY